MSDFNYPSGQGIKQSQSQAQRQRFSQIQIRAADFLTMGIAELKEEIYKEVSENPALQIISKTNKNSLGNSDSIDYHRESFDASDKYQQALENSEDKTETLQAHLMHQLNIMNISEDEYELSQKLIYNLDSNGCYGSSISPENMLDKTRPLQNMAMLNKCIKRIQAMDPVGTCCKTLEESLYVQAKITGKASPLTLFILDGNLGLISPPDPKKILRKLREYKEKWHKKKFSSEIILDKINLSEELIQESINFILKLNPRPAQGYTRDTLSEYEQPDIVLSVEKKKGYAESDDYSKGIISYDNDIHFQVKYASGVLPEIKINPGFNLSKEYVNKAKIFINILSYRESSIVVQGCAIVAAQKNFFAKGFEYLKPLTRRELANRLGIHESTVSRVSSRKSSKYIQTEYGTLPMSFFFSSGVSSTSDENIKISSEVIKMKMYEIISSSKRNISDLQLANMLNRRGIKIARRTVAKYRQQMGIDNSYLRK